MTRDQKIANAAREFLDLGFPDPTPEEDALRAALALPPDPPATVTDRERALVRAGAAGDGGPWTDSEVDDAIIASVDRTHPRPPERAEVSASVVASAAVARLEAIEAEELERLRLDPASGWHAYAAALMQQTASSMDRELATLARVGPPPSATAAEACRCGSGAHPRPCMVHPHAFAEHVLELNADTIREEAYERAARVCDDLSRLPQMERHRVALEVASGSVRALASQPAPTEPVDVGPPVKDCTPTDACGACWECDSAIVPPPGRSHGDRSGDAEPVDVDVVASIVKELRAKGKELLNARNGSPSAGTHWQRFDYALGLVDALADSIEAKYGKGGA